MALTWRIRIVFFSHTLITWLFWRYGAIDPWVTRYIRNRNTQHGNCSPISLTHQQLIMFSLIMTQQCGCGAKYTLDSSQRNLPLIQYLTVPFFVYPYLSYYNTTLKLSLPVPPQSLNQDDLTRATHTHVLSKPNCKPVKYICFA